MGVEEILVSQPDGAFPIAFVSDAAAQTANSKHIETLKSRPILRQEMIVGIQTKMAGQVRAFFLIHYLLAFDTLFQRVENRADVPLLQV